MHTDKLFVVFGSDSRFKYTLEALKKSGHSAVSFNEASFPDAKADKALVLPLPFSRDMKSVNMPKLPYAVTLSGILGTLKEGDLVFGGMLTDGFKTQAAAKGAVCHDYYDGEMIHENAMLTALCLLKLFDEEGIDAKAAKFAVTGFGRTAKAIAKVFTDRDIDFIITARGESAENAVKSMNYGFVKLESFTEETQDYDVIINTVPALIFDGQKLSALRSGVPIIDIASAPFGVTQSDADKYGVKLIRALGLPGKYMPREAGTLIAGRIEYYLKGGR